MVLASKLYPDQSSTAMANNTWRDRSVHGGTAWHFGHCGITSGATGDCSMGLVGSFGLSSQAAKSGCTNHRIAEGTVEQRAAMIDKIEAPHVPKAVLSHQR